MKYYYFVGNREEDTNFGVAKAKGAGSLLGPFYYLKHPPRNQFK